MRFRFHLDSFFSVRKPCNSTANHWLGHSFASRVCASTYSMHHTNSTAARFWLSLQSI